MQIFLLAVAAIVTVILPHCNGLDCTENSMCGGINITSKDQLKDDHELKGCQHSNGSVIINFSEETELMMDDFELFSCLERIDGALSFVNVALMEQIVIPNLRLIGGNQMIADTNYSLQVSDVFGGDIIFPNLMEITRGDAYFDIINDVCGYLGVNWSLILRDGQLVNESVGCNETSSCDNCPTGQCWSPIYCQEPAANMPQEDGDSDPFYIDLWNEQRTLVITVGGVIVGIILLLFICCCSCCCYWCYQQRRKRRSGSMRVAGTMDPEMQRKFNFTLKELPLVKIEREPADPPKKHKIDVAESNHFELAHLLGNSSCGEVHKGYWHIDLSNVSYSVAIKVFGTPSPNYEQLVKEKLQKFSGLDHKNVLRLCSVSYSPKLMLAYEFVPNNLRQHLMQNKSTLSASDLITMATQITKGMEYLTSKGISHGNLAARNVMVHQSGIAKVTDYDLFDLTTKSDWLPIRWLAPETLKYRKHNEQSDVWSYGVTVWEIMTFGAHPYHGKPTEDMLRSFEDGQRLQQPITVTAELQSILVECWCLDPMKRPSFSNMVKSMATCQSNPSQYVLTTADGKLETYSKLPPAATDANPYENLADIDEAGYLLMMSHNPNNLEPSGARGPLHSASISSDNLMNGKVASTSFMSSDVRVQDEIYANSQPELPVYEDPQKPSDQSGQIYEQTEMYSNPDTNDVDGQLYEQTDPDKDDTGGRVYEQTDPDADDADGQLYEQTDPDKDDAGGELYELMDRKDSPEDEMSKQDLPAQNHVHASTEAVYDDTVGLLDHSDRGYEKMKAGVSIGDINAEYVYAVKQDNAVKQDKKALTESELYEVPDPDGYENIRRDKPKTSKDKKEDEYLELKKEFHESQIYSNIQ